MRTADGHLSFVYKAAAEIGELGDNTRSLRAAIAGDDLLRLALAGDTASAVVLGHTRWASVGIISQPNAHPLDSHELERTDGPYVTAVLNGDVDNFADLKAADGLRRRGRDHHRRQGDPHARVPAARRGPRPRPTPSATRWPASRARSPSRPAPPPHPDQLLLALRGSGQALYVGLADGCYIVASEPYGVVELTDTYLRMDGETPANPDNPTASRGQIVVLDGARAGTARRASRGRPTTAPQLPVGRGRARSTPRSPPGTSTAAPSRTSC